MSEQQSPVPRVEVSLYFDGSARPVGSRWEVQGGWLAVAFGAVPLLAAGIFGPTFRPTHDPTGAEWDALKAGLDWLANVRTIDRLVIRGDSKMVIDALQTGNRSGSSGRPGVCLDALKKMNVPYRASWIPREGNGLADRLSKGTPADLLEIAIRLAPLSRDQPDAPEPPVPSPNEGLTRALAEQLWRAAGCPHGEDERFWFAAEHFLRAARAS